MTNEQPSKGDYSVEMFSVDSTLSQIDNAN